MTTLHPDRTPCCRPLASRVPRVGGPPEAARPAAAAAPGSEGRASARRFHGGNRERAYPCAEETVPCRPSRGEGLPEIPCPAPASRRSDRARRSSCPRPSGSRCLLNRADSGCGWKASGARDESLHSALHLPSRGAADTGPRRHRKTPDTPRAIFRRSRA